MPNSASSNSHIVSVKNLSFSRGSRKIFDDITLTIPRGKITAIMGPSGTGKTTLLKLIGGQLFPDSGQIRVDGQNVHRLKTGELYELRKRIGMLFQSGALLTDMNVYDNVAFPLREHTHLPESMIRSLVLMKLHAVGLRGARDLMPAELSGGADYIYVLSGGKIVGEGSPKQLAESDSAWVQQFINGDADGPVHFHYPANDYLDDLLTSR
jgi:phospholipid/cholesterol/gamma-HCH transport system ATP-binding protein